MLLNYRLITSVDLNNTIPIVMIHGLFGDLNNLGMLSKSLSKYYNVIQIDLRNHGSSFHDPIMTYTIMAQDILNLLDYLAIKKCIVIGHSMGGKVAMTLSIFFIQRIEKIIVIDIAPKKYNIHKYQKIFYVIQYINDAKLTNKNDVIDVMIKNKIRPNIILFLLKSFRQGKWKFNSNFIINNQVSINDWTTHQICQIPSLFIKGSLSSYIKNSYIKEIYHQFPCAHVHTVLNAKHWVHYDNPIYVFNIIKNFISIKI